MILCIDVGNTHTHFGVWDEKEAVKIGQVPTRLIDDGDAGMPSVIMRLNAELPVKGLAFCSVVPAATTKLESVLSRIQFAQPIVKLTCEAELGVPIHYPKPKEIGPDRLANAAAARALSNGPVVVIDMGTAVTFDIVSSKNGYEGGIIAPGVDVMRRYLHEQTALLPLLDDSLDVPRAIGQSTAEAMRIGTVIGFGGMIKALLDAVLAELAGRGEHSPMILATGGSAALLQKTLSIPFSVMPDLTLRGLAVVWKRTHAQKS